MGFPAETIRNAGYHAVWRGEKRWNGVAILARWAPVMTRRELPGDPDDEQSRYLEAAVNGVLDRLNLCSKRKPSARAQVRL